MSLQENSRMVRAGLMSAGLRTVLALTVALAPQACCCRVAAAAEAVGSIFSRRSPTAEARCCPRCSQRQAQDRKVPQPAPCKNCTNCDQAAAAPIGKTLMLKAIAADLALSI